MRVKIEFLLLLLDNIDKGLYLSQIANSMGMSKQALNYHIKRLRKLGIIERTQSYPMSIYIITPFGKRVKENMRYPDNLKPVWRCHALQVGYWISDFGTFRFIENNNRKLCRMKGWEYASETQGEHHIKIQENGLMIISCPDTYSNDPDQAFGELRIKANTIAQWYRDHYEMQMKAQQTIRRGQKSLVGSEVLSKLFGKGKITDKVWIDASGGTDEIETYEKEYSVEKLLALPDVIDNKLTPAIEKLTKQIELHLEVMNNMNETLKVIKKSFEKSE
jgi:DNA-binding transcriptional ArsR family regulator